MAFLGVLEIYHLSGVRDNLVMRLTNCEFWECFVDDAETSRQG
jgi:hypothetical protein